MTVNQETLLRSSHQTHGSAPPLVVVTAAMGPRGETGVQTHFNDFIAYLKTTERPVVFVGPDEARIRYRYVDLVNSVIGRLIPVCGRLAHYGLRQMTFYTTRSELKRRLPPAADWCVYAQDPITARSAISLRRTATQRVVLAVHYNRSQAEEMADRAILSKGDWLFQRILREEATALKEVDQVIVFSAFMRDEISRDPTLASKINVIPNTASMPIPSPGAIPRDLIAIGTLEPRKNQAFLLQVLFAAKQMHHEYTLAVLGSGEDREPLEALARKLGLANQVFFLGRVANAASLLSAHRLLVHAARIENLPVALIEALAAGIPILAAPVGGIPEIFSEGIEGRFWNLDDVQGSAKLLIDLLEDEQLRSRMGQAARDRYVAHFSPEKVLSAIAAVVLGDASLPAIREQTPAFCNQAS